MGEPAPSDLSQLDQVNLVQALKDFEIANARVLDLTRRLIETENQRRALEDELARLKLNESRSLVLARNAYGLATKVVGKVANRVMKVALSRERR